MPVPIIAGAAAAVVARLAAKKAAQELAKKAAKAATAKTAQIAKNSVKTKPARKPVGNPRNPAKELDGVANSFYRSSNPYTGIVDGVRSAGKSRAGRVANSKLSKKTVKSAKEPARRPTPDGRSPFSYKTVEINSAFKKTADSARAANTSRPKVNSSNSVKVKPAAKPTPNKPDAVKTQFKNDSSRNRASDRTMKEYEKNVTRHGERPTDPSFGSKLAERVALNTKLKRKPNLNTASSNAAKKPAPANIPSRTPANPARATVKINSAKTVRVVRVAPRASASRTRSGKPAKKK